MALTPTIALTAPICLMLSMLSMFSMFGQRSANVRPTFGISLRAYELTYEPTYKLAYEPTYSASAKVSEHNQFYTKTYPLCSKISAQYYKGPLPNNLLSNKTL